MEEGGATEKAPRHPRWGWGATPQEGSGYAVNDARDVQKVDIKNDFLFAPSRVVLSG